jgi:hypothetical protein
LQFAPVVDGLRRPANDHQQELMRVIAGPDALSIRDFRTIHLMDSVVLRNLEQYGNAFLRTMDEDFHAFAARAATTQPRSGFGRLTDVEAG